MMTRITRILLGLIFVVFSANYFVPFLPQPGPDAMSPGALAFAMAFMSSGFMTFIKVIEMAAGLALLANRFTTLALALLAPIVVGIFTFHLLLAPSGMLIAITVLVLEVALAWSYRRTYLPMLRMQPDQAPTFMLGEQQRVAGSPTNARSATL